jgi:replicative DNA helicase
VIAYDWTQNPGDDRTSDRAERALLGVLLLEGPAGLALCARLRADDFRSPHRGAVLTTMRKLAFLGEPVDALAVADALERGKVPAPSAPGWFTAVGSLLDDSTIGAADADSVRAYARIVAEGSLYRRRATWGAA